MTLEEIERSQVNLDIAREAFDQASKRLADMLDTKKAFEQKAFTLFSGVPDAFNCLVRCGRDAL